MRPFARRFLKANDAYPLLNAASVKADGVATAMLCGTAIETLAFVMGGALAG